VTAGDAGVPEFEKYPLTRQEYINAMVHFYRGEMHRSQIWRTRLGPAQEAAVWPTKSLLESGVHLAIGSDAVTTVPGPFVDLYFAQINPSNPAEAISLQNAIVAYTKGSAYAEFQEKEKGSR